MPDLQALAASRGWTLVFTTKLHPAPRANINDFAYFPVGTNSACALQDSRTGFLILQLLRACTYDAA